MAQVVSVLFFTLACMAAIAFVAAMLRDEWGRVIAIVAGCELEQAYDAAPRVRVRVRAWPRAEERRPGPAKYAAAA